MRAIVCTKYGPPDVLHLQDVPQPAPKDDEVLIRVHAASVNAADLHLLRADPFLIRLESGLLKPKRKILGADVAGRVEAVGRSAAQFKPGNEVFGDISSSGWGGFAEFVCARESALVMKPANISYEQAAAVPMAAVTALQGLRKQGKIRAGQKVLIHGASGGVGSFAVQIAKSFGVEVTAVCSTGKVELVRSLGADHVIDYTREDFAKSGRTYDLILVANGNRSIYDYKRALAPGGTYVLAGGAMSQLMQTMLLGPWLSMTSGVKMGSFLALTNQDDLTYLKTLLEAGKVTPVIDKTFALSDVPQAMRYLEEGHAAGKVVIAVQPEGR